MNMTTRLRLEETSEQLRALFAAFGRNMIRDRKI